MPSGIPVFVQLFLEKRFFYKLNGAAFLLHRLRIDLLRKEPMIQLPEQSPILQFFQRWLCPIGKINLFTSQNQCRQWSQYMIRPLLFFQLFQRSISLQKNWLHFEG